MAFIRCKKHPDIVMHRKVDWLASIGAAEYQYEPGLRCRVCEEIRPLKQEIRDLRSAVEFMHYTYPGKGRCRCCTVCRAQGHIELLTGEKWYLCRSCLGIVRNRMKSLHKRLEKEATAMNAEPGQGRPE